MKLVITACCLAVALVFTGCSSSTSSGGGDDNGDTNNDPTFANVQDIFNSSCGGSGCHIGRTESGVRLDGYDNVINSEGVQYGVLVVQPGDAAGSPLVDKIEPDPEEGLRMPRNRAPLSDSEISLIRQWIDNGAQNN